MYHRLQAQQHISHILLDGEIVTAVSLDKPLEWAVGFFFGNVEPLDGYSLYIGIG